MLAPPTINLCRFFSSIKKNIPPHIEAKIGRNLHRQKGHPLNIISKRISNFFNQKESFAVIDNLSPIVDPIRCFDHLLVPKDHISRQPSDTYYFNENSLLRTHTSAHQTSLIQDGNNAFLCFGDVYRRDTVDGTHYPVFHQCEGVKLWDKGTISEEEISQDLKTTLTDLAKSLFNDPNLNSKWIDEYFPFTDPSYELEIFFNNDWLEVLGCGVIEPKVLENANSSNKVGWAFGLGLERLAMVLFQIPDIRLFWSEDPRFLSQFKDTPEDSSDPKAFSTKFKSFSSFPPCTKDISFWIPPEFHEHDFYELVRQEAGDLAESISLLDEFTHPKSGRQSKAYRITYRSMDRNLTNQEIDEIQFRIRDLVPKLQVELR